MSEEIRAKILQRAADLAGVDVAEINGESTLESLGLDSSDAVILAMEVEEETGREIDVGIFLRFEKLREAADEIIRLLAK
ncbi:MAG: acyl carrier protein [Bauldia sp.]